MSASEKLRKIATGFCLVAGPLGLLIGVFLHPEESRDAGEQLRIIAAEAGMWATAHYVIAGAAVLLAGAVVGLAHLLHERGPGQAIVGGALGVVGAMSLCTVAFSEATFGAELGQNPNDPAVVAAFSAVSASPASFVIFLGALLGPIAFIVLGYGILRSQVAPQWVALALMAGGVSLTVGLPLNVWALVIAGAALQTIAMGTIGVMVLGESDEEWMHTPAPAAT